jgi:hypothetical protein
MSKDKDFVLEKCPRCGYETPVEPLGNEEGVLEVVVCAQCGNPFIQTPIGPPGSKPSLMPTEDKRQQRKLGVIDKIKQWWQDRRKS